jgi:hypothetical protein
LPSSSSPHTFIAEPCCRATSIDRSSTPLHHPWERGSKKTWGQGGHDIHAIIVYALIIDLSVHLVVISNYIVDLHFHV